MAAHSPLMRTAGELRWRRSMQRTLAVLVVSAVVIGARAYLPHTRWVAAIAAGLLCVDAWWLARWGPRRLGANNAPRRTSRVLRRVPSLSVVEALRLPRSRSTTDHVAIGPAGIYVIHSYRYRGLLRVRDGAHGRTLVIGRRRLDSHLQDVKRDARRLSDLLRRFPEAHSVATCPVVPVLCIHGASITRGRVLADGTRVVAGAALPGYLERRTQVLEPADVQRVAAALLGKPAPG